MAYYNRKQGEHMAGVFLDMAVGNLKGPPGATSRHALDRLRGGYQNERAMAALNISAGNIPGPLTSRDALNELRIGAGVSSLPRLGSRSYPMPNGAGSEAYGERLGLGAGIELSKRNIGALRSPRSGEAPGTGGYAPAARIRSRRSGPDPDRPGPDMRRFMEERLKRSGGRGRVQPEIPRF